MTLSAPKSVSVIALAGGDERLVAAHCASIEVALREAEEHAAARVRVADANEDRTTGNMVVALYHHDTSRTLDPQLHSHAVAANLTFDGTECRWKALQMSGIYESHAYVTAVYRNELATRVKGLGYEIENKRDAKARDRGFEIKGVPEAVLEKYSRRSRQRDRAIGEFEKEHVRPPTKNEVAVLVRISRPDKLIVISPEAVRDLQNGMLTARELEQIRAIKAMAWANRRSLSQGDARGPLGFAKDHVFQRVSVASDHKILTAALQYGRGAIQLADLKAELELQKCSRELLSVKHEIATYGTLTRERAMISRIDAGVGLYESLGNYSRFKTSTKLRLEQQRAVECVLNSRDFAVNIQGAAGTGKTRMLQELERGFREAGRPGVAVAPTRSAVQELEKSGFQDAMTIEQLLQDEKAQASLKGKVLIVDEAGMVCGRRMSALMELSNQHSARVVFAGDTRQIQSVEASDALRILEQESKLKGVSLRKVQRQAKPDYREAIELPRASPAKGFELLETSGRVKAITGRDRPQAVAEEYRRALSHPNAAGREPNVLVICSTHEAIHRVTEAIREQRKQTGELAQGATLYRHEPLSWTEAQKRDFRNYRESHVLEFHRAVIGVAQNESVAVLRADADRLEAKNRRGKNEL